MMNGMFLSQPLPFSASMNSQIHFLEFVICRLISSSIWLSRQTSILDLLTSNPTEIIDFKSVFLKISMLIWKYGWRNKIREDQLCFKNCLLGYTSWYCTRIALPIDTFFKHNSEIGIDSLSYLKESGVRTLSISLDFSHDSLMNSNDWIKFILPFSYSRGQGWGLLSHWSNWLSSSQSSRSSV